MIIECLTRKLCIMINTYISYPSHLQFYLYNIYIYIFRISITRGIIVNKNYDEFWCIYNNLSIYILIWLRKSFCMGKYFKITITIRILLLNYIFKDRRCNRLHYLMHKINLEIFMYLYIMVFKFKKFLNRYHTDKQLCFYIFFI